MMTLEILMSCMHQKDESLVYASKITGDCVVINQTDCEDYAEFSSENGTIRMFSDTKRGITKSRNEAIRRAKGDICLLCDDDEVFVPDYESIILGAYEKIPQADIIIFKVKNYPVSLEDKVMRLRFPKTMKVCSWQMSFRREKLLESGIVFDELLGAGSGNGAEEELKFLIECERKGLKIYYVPEEIASVTHTESTWFDGYDEKFFENRGATTRYILGFLLSSVYAVYYVVRKKDLYKDEISSADALRATFRGIIENKITKQKRQKGQQ